MITKLRKIRRTLDPDHIADPYTATLEAVRSASLSLKKGARIAVAVGSRGIAGLDRIVKAVTTAVEEAGGRPFIVPAMGSHGGATPEGQREVLAGYGVSEEALGVPVLSSLDVYELPRGPSPCPVYIDRHAAEADGTIVINRVKAHTDFRGPVESGLVKMCVIGLGKHKQALAIHIHGVTGLREHIPVCARQVLKHGNILLGVATVENALHQTSVIRAIRPADIFHEEEKLLVRAREEMARLPVDELDILIIDRYGKDISGTGVDTNVIGRIRIEGEPEPDAPRIKAIILDDLTEESHGNAIGMGLADFITRRIFDKIDLHATTENVVTSTFLERGKIPVIGETMDRCLEYARRVSRICEESALRVARIPSTLDTHNLYVSDPVWREIDGSDERWEVVAEPADILDGDGNLLPF